ncbi:hypothetical protein JTE90_002197 [Oedothorax gibbosus]|uniref:Calcineurin-binding protein cabin-1 n=1 Tax=Oedothorax gibbosus TaxID=931172 RepID=A0AAV6VHT7_9ARAC|nr:hypothetical protein JTE90_002197 [Oedothorax gibbosus]
MMKFSALNESSLSDDNGDPELATREAQEEEAYSLYHLALKKQSQGKVEESETLLKEILEMEFLTQIQPNEDDSDDDDEEGKKEGAPLRPALTLKYLLHKNLGKIANDRKDYQAAVAFFLDALEIDNTDVMMWYQMGKASINIANYSLARLCFEEGLKCNPNHWPCLDNVITVMYTLNDYANCLYYIAKALERECYYLKGLVFRDEIYREDPSLKSFCEGYFNNCDSSINHAEYDKEEAKQLIQESLDMRIKNQSFYKPTPLPVLTLNQPIKEKTWKDIGESLVNMYECIKMANPSVSYSYKIDLSPFLELSTVAMDTDKPPSSSASSLSCSSSSAAVVKPEGLLQLADVPSHFQRSSVIEVTPMEVDVDETPAESPYNLVLAPVENHPTDLLIDRSDSTSSSRRMSKRKRLLSELAEFSTKRRSSRVRNPAVKKPQDNVNYQELLQKFLPPKLMGNGKCEDADDDSEPVSLDKELSCGPSTENDKSDKTTESGDLSWSEKEDVVQFISSNQNNSGIIDLLYNYVVILGKKSACVWPKNLIDVFCEAFSRLRNHITTPNLFCQSSDPERIKEVSLAMLCYCEFKIDKWYLSTGHSMSFSPKSTSGTATFQSSPKGVGNDFHADMEFLVMLTARRDVLGSDWLDFTARAFWIKAKFHSLEGEIDLAVCCMGRLNDILVEENDAKITVRNCSFSNIIASEKVNRQLESLQRCQSLEEVQRLYEQGDYAAVVNLLIPTFNQPTTKRKHSLEGVPERHAQLLLLQNSLWRLERYKECVHWSEVSFNEALQQFMNAARSDWSETMAQLLNGLNNCVKLDPGYLSDLEEPVRLTQNLILVIVIQMENYDFSADNASLLIVLPWMLLYRLILNEEKRSNTSKKSAPVKTVEPASAGNSSNNKSSAVASFLSDFDLNSAMPSSLMLLFTAHEYLGRRSWCTFADGQLLLFNINVMMGELADTQGSTHLYREDLETGLEQCIYCLYGHPNKRSRAKHLQEHNSKQLTLTWERAALIFQYFRPNVLPEFDSYRTSTVSAELESLLKRIIALVPPDQDPTSKVDSYTAYIEGATDKCPEPPFKDKELSSMIKDLYYLLGDYYFKNKEFSKAIRFYLMDICFNPERQDSWAGMALSRSSQLEQKLTSYELRNESTVYRKSSAALKCFEHALRLDPTTTPLWIEHGSLAYILHSHASRQLKQDCVMDDLQDLLRRKRTEMLSVAERCFRSANRCEEPGSEPEEAWLHHYMLGKIAEKKGERPQVYLPHYTKALAYLHEDCARYPQKILYHNPAEMSIEALEVYYRVHASCLKFLWRHEGKGTDFSTLRVIRRCLAEIARSPFANFQEKCKKEEEEAGSGSSATLSEVEEVIIVEPEVPPVQTSNVDHNYFDLVSQKDKRQSRPSIDSSPDTQDSGGVKEVMESLVGVVTERFVDEECEKEKVSSAKIPVESVGEQSVYTSKVAKDVEPVVPESEDDIAARAVKSIVMECTNPITPPEIVTDETSEDVLIPDRSMELESATAASLLVEEMRLEGNTDYCDFDMYCPDPPKQEDQDSAYDDRMDIADSGTSSAEAPVDGDVQLAVAKVLEQLEEQEATNNTGGNNGAVSSSASVNVTRSSVVGKEDGVDSSIMEVDGHLNPGFLKSEEGVRMEVDREQVPVGKESEVVEAHVSQTGKVAKAAPESGLIPTTIRPKTVIGEPIDRPYSSVIKGNTENVIAGGVIKEVAHVVQETKEVKPLEMKPVSSSEKTVEGTSKNKATVAKAGKPSKSGDSTRKKRRDPPSTKELRASLSEIDALVPVCLEAMRECLNRFIQHYKALYRMAHYYCYSPRNKNLQWAREILLAATPATKKYAAMPGLFADRKNTNFFNGIWRAPSTEIDRPGSFGAHMYRSVGLLIEVLTQQKDYNMLVYLTQQLYRTPDLGKKYMRDTDRVYLVRLAYERCTAVLRGRMDSLLQEEPPPEEGRLTCCLLEIFRACQTLLRAGVYARETNALLEEAYTMYRLGEVDDHPSVLEQATKFCQLQLGKSYPQNPYEFTKFGSKYLGVPDDSPANLFPPDAWQKEYTKSLLASSPPFSSRPIKPEPIQEPVLLIPIDSSQFAGSLMPTRSPMVHVEKPKAENLHACSLAYLPLTPVLPNSSINPVLPNTSINPGLSKGPSLVSCQAFDCFSVLKSIMQASGYQVDTATPVNLVKPKNSEIQPPPPNFPCFQAARGGVGRPRKRRRRAAAKMDEALNLCKRVAAPPVVASGPLSRPLYTRPIVSSSIAHSIAELKVGSIMRSTPKAQPATHATSVRNQPRPPFIKTIVRSPSVSIVQQVPYTATSDSGVPRQKESLLSVASTSQAKSDIGISLLDKKSPSLHRGTRLLTEAPSLMDANEDSSSSTHIDTSVIEQCAREMLEFINQRVEDLVHNTKPPVDFSNITVRAGECSLREERTLLANVDDSKNRNKNNQKSNSSILFQHLILKKEESKNTAFDEGSEKGIGVSSVNWDSKNTKVVGPDVNNVPEKSIEENIKSKINTMIKDIEEENSDTLDADIKDDLFTNTEPQTFSGVENQLEISKDDSTKSLLLESCDLSKDSSTEFAVCSPK